MDFDDSGSVELLDALGVLYYLYQNGDDPASPFPDCGLDETEDFATGGDLGCKSSLSDCD